MPSTSQWMCFALACAAPGASAFMASWDEIAPPCITEGLSALPTSVAKAGTVKFASDLMEAEEQQIFGTCAWPLDPLALRQRVSEPKGGLLAKDSSTIFALLLFFTFGSVAMHGDMSEFEEDEHEEDMRKAVSKNADLSHQPSRLPLPAIGTFLALFLAAAWKTAQSGNVPAMCLRSPVLVARHTPLTALGGRALAELLHLPGLHLSPAAEPSLATDTMVAAALLAFGVLGAAVMCTDVLEMVEDMVAEEEAPVKNVQKQSQDDKLSVSASCVQKDKKQMPLLTKLAKNWRLVSCVVLLLALFGSVVASIFE